MNKMLRLIQVGILLVFAAKSVAFSSHSLSRTQRIGLLNKRPIRDNSSLFGIKEWRESIEKDEAPILLLPFAASEALLPGQSTNIVLKEGRFYDLFQDCMDDYESIVGMVLMGQDGLLREMPLCEIEDFDVEAGFRGKVTVSVTLRAVARAKIVEFTAMKPIMMGICTELKDDEVLDEDLANELVDDIETTIQDMNLRESYEKAFLLALESEESISTSEHDSASDDNRSSIRRRSMSDLSAVSWAVLACVSDSSCRHKAIASTCVADRLELGLRALLNAKYQTSTISSESDNESSFE